MSSSSSSSGVSRPKTRPSRERTQLFAFTMNNPALDGRLLLDGLRLRGQVSYLVYGIEEAPTTGTPHYQGMCRTVKPVEIGGARLMLPGCHVERVYSSAQKAADYCKKGGRFVEHGKLPEGIAGKKKRDYADILEKCKEGKFEELDPSVFFNRYSTCKRVRQDYMVAPPDNDEVCGVWLYGAPGGGKSYYARHDLVGTESLYLKPANKWWDGYQGQHHVLIDDFDHNHKCLGHHLKLWADRYAFAAEQKGTTVQIRPAGKIIITSNYSIPEIFGEDQALTEALQRRFKVFLVQDRVVTPQ